MQYDHDQREREFFNKEFNKTAAGCMRIIRIGFWILMVSAIIWYAISCKPISYPVTEATGTVISIDGDNVLVAFEVINKDKGSQGSNWFYCPKHTFKKGDRWPDPSKYKEGNNP